MFVLQAWGVPRLNSLRFFSTKNLTGQARVQGSGVSGLSIDDCRLSNWFWCQHKIYLPYYNKRITLNVWLNYGVIVALDAFMKKVNYQNSEILILMLQMSCLLRYLANISNPNNSWRIYLVLYIFKIRHTVIFFKINSSHWCGPDSPICFVTRGSR